MNYILLNVVRHDGSTGNQLRLYKLFICGIHMRCAVSTKVTAESWAIF